MENLNNHIQFKSFVGEIEIDYKPKRIPKKKIKSSQDCYNTLKPLYSCINYKEKSWAIFLNRAMNTIGYARISDGASNATLIDTKIVLQHALMSHASSIVISHNHPSGNKKPSEADIQITEKLKKACELFDINLIDHLILTDESYLSFADEGIL